MPFARARVNSEVGATLNFGHQSYKTGRISRRPKALILLPMRNDILCGRSEES